MRKGDASEITFSPISFESFPFYFSGYKTDPAKIEIWKTATDGAPVESISESCGYVEDMSTDGQYLLTGFGPGGGVGIYEFSLAQLSRQRCTIQLT